MTIRIWNDGNPIRIVETTTNDHSLQITWNPHQNTLHITHIASTFKSEANPNQANPLSQSQKHHHSLSFHSYNPINTTKSESSPSSTQSKSITKTQLHTHQHFTSTTQNSTSFQIRPQSLKLKQILSYHHLYPSLTIIIHYLQPIPTTRPNHTPFRLSSPSSPHSH